MVHVHQIKVGPSWMDSIVLYLREDILPEDKSETEKIRRKAPRFWLSEDQKLYKRSFSRPYLLYVHPEATELLLEELYEGICGSHTRQIFVSQSHHSRPRLSKSGSYVGLWEVGGIVDRRIGSWIVICKYYLKMPKTSKCDTLLEYFLFESN